ncbi:MAG: archaeal proteasome endopeptidase complex subunit alpha [Nanoarchaeota archaeon]|nr:archaeal proteasome endopeptidase complex subunit alpha [Nanoarchaeota archaeon]
MDLGEIGGYDRTITMFSPDGRLLQVEYARGTVSKGATAIGVVFDKGVVIITDKKVSGKLVVPKSIEKIFKLDDHVSATMSGLVGDGRILIEKARNIAQKYRVTYDEPIDVLTLVKQIADHKQAYTQYGGARPYGVSLIIAGVDSTGPRLLVTDPSGVYFEYLATAIGEGSDIVIKYLEKEYKKEMKMQDAIKLGVGALKKVLGNKFQKERLEVAVVDGKKKFERLDHKEVDKQLK